MLKIIIIIITHRYPPKLGWTDRRTELSFICPANFVTAEDNNIFRKEMNQQCMMLKLSKNLQSTSGMSTTLNNENNA